MKPIPGSINNTIKYWPERGRQLSVIHGINLERIQMKKYMQVSQWVFVLTLFCAGCVATYRQETVQPVHQQPKIAVSSASFDNLTQVFTTSPDIKTASKAGSFALVRISPYIKELKGSNEVCIRNPNSFPVLIMIRCEEKGLHIEMPARSKTYVYLPNGGFQVSYVFANVPNAVMRGDHIHLPAINRVNIDIPVNTNPQF
ncbi:MAG: hypothetical protein A2283_10795 [Lentisphaerae bacterium RIFOXYA12_FULL_48_11]|nr:MAG: hypothetical protein A2283_10795 [Lentisphaerae bacterium RIFOXYA12_FULL_48_11]